MLTTNDVLNEIARRQLAERGPAAKKAQDRVKEQRVAMNLKDLPAGPFVDGDPRCLHRPPEGPWEVRPGILSCEMERGNECDGSAHRRPGWSNTSRRYLWFVFGICPILKAEREANRASQVRAIEDKKTHSNWRNRHGSK